MADNMNTNQPNDPKDSQSNDQDQTNEQPKNANESTHDPKMTPNKKSTKPAWASAVIGGLVGALLVGGVGYGIQHQGGGTVSRSEVESLLQNKTAESNSQKASSQSSTNEQQASLDVTTDVSTIVNKVSGAVVSVENLSQNNDKYDLFGFASPKNNSGSSSSNSSNSDSDYETSSEGSGVVYKKANGKAYIVTNNHVVSGSDALEIITPSGKQVRATLVGSDPWTDLAVMTIPEKDAEGVIELGNSDSLKVGEPAIAIGSPLGSDFASTVTTGIISGLNRQVPTDIDGDGQSDWTANAIQTDAAINPGNSGGALVNSGGQLIGINSMKISNSQVEGMGFAIPVNEVKGIVTQLEENGRVIRPELGISMMSLYQLPLDQQESVLKLPSSVEEGVIITDVKSNTPASDAGLKEYDVITKVNDTDIKDAVQLRQVLYSQKSDAKVKITYYRDGKKATVDVQLKAMDNTVDNKTTKNN
ncbi:MAG: S1C family serine protease [Aerococcus sp.]|nr:S1C family serine protease [Aerococcus sp.]